MEEKVEKKERSTVAEMIATFNSGWEAVVKLFVRLFGLTPEAARNTILVAIVPLLTAAVQIVNWLYLYVHYHLGYNVPVAYLNAETSWLMSFGIGVLLTVAFVFFLSWISIRTTGIGFLISMIVIEAFCYFISSTGLVGDEFYGLFIPGVVWFLFFYCGFVGSLDVITEDDESDTNKRGIVSYITMVLDRVAILAICVWWFRPILGWGLQQTINVYTWNFPAWIAFGCISVWNIFFLASEPRKSDARGHLCLFLVLTIFCFFLEEDFYSRMSPYALTTDYQQVVVYQSKEISVLEPATIEVDEETNEVTLTIDTSQQQIVDSTTLSYEYQSFDTVIIE